MIDTRFSQFPDGELYLQAGELDDQTIIVGSVTDSNALVQLLLLIDACDESKNTLIVPYMGYARQDQRFNPGEPVSARAVAVALSNGIERAFVVNIHQPDVVQYFRVPATNLSIAPAIGRHIQNSGFENPLVLGPDEGAINFASSVAAVGGWDFDYLEKTRLSGEVVRMEPKNLDADSRTVVIVDDIISTGGTLATAAGMLYRQGATAVHAICVHGVLTGGAYTRLRSAGIRTLTSGDTYESACSRISAADTIAHALTPC